MRQSTPLLLLAVFIPYIHSAPQFISFKDGKLGVNFGGYHAGVGIGGLLGGAGGAGGLYAEAGTPTGQSARAGLGGSVSENGGAAGGLYAGATAGGNIKASAGLAGGVGAEHSAGAGYASAQAGHHYAASGMGGESSIGGASEFSFSSKPIVPPVHPVEVKPVEKKIHAEFNVDALNEVQPLPSHTDTEVKTHIEKKIVHENVQPVIVKEVYVQPPPTTVVEKEIIHTHYKPRRHHFRKTAFVSGYVGGQGDVGAPVVYKTVEPQIQKRIDVAAESFAHADAGAAIEGSVNGGAGGGHLYTKQVTYQKSPTFFEDIFNIPISTLKAVGSFLGNTAANTNVSVQKSASVQAESDSLKHDPSLSSSTSSASSAAHVSVETPNPSKFIEDIFAIPINTLGAVNKFLQNNVGRKTVQVSEDGSVDEGRVRRGPHARRKAHKRVVIVEETPVKPEE